MNCRPKHPGHRAASMLFAILFVSFHFQPACAQTESLTKAQQEGRAIALDLCQRRPSQNLASSGTFQFRDAKGRRSEVRASFSTTLKDSGWENMYCTAPTNSQDTAHTARLVVIHRENQPVEYRLYKHEGPGSEANSYQSLAGNAAMIPFAGSDFWLADLGLEFLHWPEQQLLKKEMHRSESCYVLESTNPNPAPGAYRRVKSWIHIESGGIVEAQAFGINGKLLKTFLPDSFKKVAGKYELKSMKMLNEQDDTRTSIEFDLEIKQTP